MIQQCVFLHPKLVLKQYMVHQKHKNKYRQAWYWPSLVDYIYQIPLINRKSQYIYIYQFREFWLEPLKHGLCVKENVCNVVIHIVYYISDGSTQILWTEYPTYRWRELNLKRYLCTNKYLTKTQINVNFSSSIYFKQPLVFLFYRMSYGLCAFDKFYDNNNIEYKKNAKLFK